MIYHLAGKLAILIIKIFSLLEVKGKQHIPADHRFIVTCSHRSWVDVVLLAAALFPIHVHYMAKKELFQNTLIGWFLKKMHAFPVSRENPGPSALKIPLKLLKENKVVGIFPSGTRTDEEVPLKRGAVTIAMKAGVPILPATYHGPKSLKDFFAGKKAVVAFGEPIYLEKNANQIDDALQQLEHKLKALEKSIND